MRAKEMSNNIMKEILMKKFSEKEDDDLAQEYYDNIDLEDDSFNEIRIEDIKKKLLDSFSLKQDLKKLRQECHELELAISDYLNFPLNGFNDIIDELADIEVLITRLKSRKNEDSSILIKDQVDNVVKQKIERTYKRMKEGLL